MAQSVVAPPTSKTEGLSGRPTSQAPQGAPPDAVPAVGSLPASGRGAADSPSFLDRLPPAVRSWVEAHGHTRTSSGIKVLCPAHADKNPSLHVSAGDHIDGLVLKCHAGCEPEAVLEAWDITWADLFDGRRGTGGGSRAPAKRDLSEAEADFRNGVYAYLLARLRESAAEQQAKLPPAWRWEADLLRRGLAREEIDRRGYAPMTGGALSEAAHELYEAVPRDLIRVPGFYRSRQLFLGSDRPRPFVPCLEGLAIPVRDVKGRVIALQVRTGDPDRKYVWFSGKTSSGTPCHIPLGLPARCPVVRVTEGPLKADVATVLDPQRIPTIGIAGVASWRAALPVLQQLKAGVVGIAFDMDLWWKRPVFAQLQAFAAELIDRNYVVLREVWDEKDGKGIDDLFLAGGRPTAEEVVA